MDIAKIPGSTPRIKPKLSMVVPSYIYNLELQDMTENCVLSYLDQVDEMIIVEDGGLFSINLQKLCDTYIYHKDNRGFTENVNIGWKVARGDYVAIVNSDTYLTKGKLEDLCVPGKVTSPFFKNQDWSDFPNRLAGAFFVVPRTVFDARGMLDERTGHWGSDTEYGVRTTDIFVRVPSVEIYHEVSATHKALGVSDPEYTHPGEAIAKKIINGEM